MAWRALADWEYMPSDAIMQHCDAWSLAAATAKSSTLTVMANPQRWSKLRLAELIEAAEHDVLASMDFPREHRAKIHSTNPLERRNGEIKRSTDVVDIFTNEGASPA